MRARRLKISVVFAVDLARFLVPDVGKCRLLQELRATEEFSTLLHRHYTGNDNGLGAWVSEANRIRDHMKTVAVAGGKKVWSHQFVAQYAPLLLLRHENRLVTPERPVPADASLELPGRYRCGRFCGITYRLAVEGVVAASCEAEFMAEDNYSIREVIDVLESFREDAFRTFLHFVQDYFGNETQLGPTKDGELLSLASQENISWDELDSMTHVHTLVVIEGFTETSTAGSTVDRDRVVESVELAGILNQASWYQSYARDYCSMIKNKQIGRRSDDIYVIDQRTTVVVSAQYWNTKETIRFYRLDLLRTIEHHLTRFALLSQLLTFSREHEELHPLETKEPFDRAAAGIGRPREPYASLRVP